MRKGHAFWTRRAVLGILAASAGAVATVRAGAGERPLAKVWKDPNCGCCSGWVDHIKRSGFDVSVVDTPNLQSIKNQLGVPRDLVSCHTATVGPYVIEDTFRHRL